MRLVIKQAKTKSKYTKYSLHQYSKTTKWQLGVSLSLTSGGAPRLRRQAHAFLLNLNNQPKQQTFQQLRQSNKQRGGENGLCADPLAKSRFYRRALLSYFLFPFASSFFFFGEAIVARFLAQVNGRKIVA